MKKISHKIAAMALGLALFSTAHAQDAKQLKRERIQAGYMLSFGRAPSESEITYWQGQASMKNVNDMIAANKAYIGKDAGTKKSTIIKAYNDAMGRNPTAAEITYWSNGNHIYTELMADHVQWLKGNPAEYVNVIKRSYQYELGRQPSAPEVNYWKGQPVHSYLMLLGCHEAWKKSNGATAQKTSGSTVISSGTTPIVVTVPVSMQIAAEANAAAGIINTNGSNIVAQGGGNIVAQGGGNIVAAGGGNIVAQGGGN